MSIDKAIGVMRTEKKCVERAVLGCSRECESCDLVLPEVVEAYDIAIDSMIYRKMNEDDGK